MRHKVEGRKLGRTSSHRKAMMANMAMSLLKHERIRTTLAKAKELRRFVEPIINRAKNDSLHNKRLIRRSIHDRSILVKLFENIAPRYANRPGGYTRIIRLSTLRPGDNSKMALIELVEEALHTEKKKKKTKSEASKPKKTASSKKVEEIKEQELPFEEEAPTAEAVQPAEIQEIEAPEANVEATEEIVEEPKAETKEATAEEEKTEKKSKAKPKAKAKEEPPTEEEKKDE